MKLDPTYYEYDDKTNTYFYDQKNHPEYRFKYDDLYEGLPLYNKNQYDLNTIDDYFEYYRYIINCIIIGIPWLIIALACLGFNFYFNIVLNHDWANGNVYLLSNTYFLVFQAFNSIMLAFELPIWLHTFKIARSLSILLGTIYTVLYLAQLYEWYDMLYIVTDKSQYDLGTIFLNMCLGYNLVLHSTIIPTNIFIILKEFSMEYF